MPATEVSIGENVCNSDLAYLLSAFKSLGIRINVTLCSATVEPCAAQTSEDDRIVGLSISRKSNLVVLNGLGVLP